VQASAGSRGVIFADPIVRSNEPHRSARTTWSRRRHKADARQSRNAWNVCPDEQSSEVTFLRIVISL
jgi:hypothetical protein